MSHCCMSLSPYYLYNCCYFQVQFAAVWTRGSKGCHWLHVTNAPKAHIHTADQYPKNSFNDIMWKLHELFVCWCVSEPSILYYIVVATLEMPTGCQFLCVPLPNTDLPTGVQKGRSTWAPRHSCCNWWQKYLNWNGFILVLLPGNRPYECQLLWTYVWVHESLQHVCVWIHLSIISQRMMAAELLQGNTWRILFIWDRQ